MSTEGQPQPEVIQISGQNEGTTTATTTKEEGAEAKPNVIKMSRVKPRLTRPILAVVVSSLLLICTTVLILLILLNTPEHDHNHVTVTSRPIIPADPVPSPIVSNPATVNVNATDHHHQSSPAAGPVHDPTPEPELPDSMVYKAVLSSLTEWQLAKERRRNQTSQSQLSRHRRDEEIICYDQLLGCFRDEGPFNYLDMLPSSPVEIDTKFLLYTRKNVYKPVALSYFNFTGLNEFNVNVSTKIIIHGFGSTCGQLWATEIRLAILKMTDVNVFCIDWEAGAQLPNYVRAAVNTRLVGKQVAILINWLNTKYGSTLDDFHLIGFSLGAHVAGFAGQELKNLSRITGLDPAGPLFESYDPHVRLDSTDARFVDVIHSNGDSLLMGGLGSWEPSGHLDFYPNGGRVQKGCSNLFVGAVRDFLWAETTTDGRSLCNHRRAYKFFTESVQPTCKFPAFTCDSYEKFLAGHCFELERMKFMGYYAGVSVNELVAGINVKQQQQQHGKSSRDGKAINGYNPINSNIGPPSSPSAIVPNLNSNQILYLLTREDEPFCANQYKIIIDSSPIVPKTLTYGNLEVVLLTTTTATPLTTGLLNETFQITQSSKDTITSGTRIEKLIVTQFTVQNIQLKYTAYNGWLYSGLKKWSIDQIRIMDAFGVSWCMHRRVVLFSGFSINLILENCGHEQQLVGQYNNTFLQLDLRPPAAPVQVQLPSGPMQVSQPSELQIIGPSNDQSQWIPIIPTAEDVSSSTNSPSPEISSMSSVTNTSNTTTINSTTTTNCQSSNCSSSSTTVTQDDLTGVTQPDYIVTSLPEVLVLETNLQQTSDDNLEMSDNVLGQIHSMVDQQRDDGFESLKSNGNGTSDETTVAPDTDTSDGGVVVAAATVLNETTDRQIPPHLYHVLEQLKNEGYSSGNSNSNMGTPIIAAVEVAPAIAEGPIKAVRSGRRLMTDEHETMELVKLQPKKLLLHPITRALKSRPVSLRQGQESQRLRVHQHHQDQRMESTSRDISLAPPLGHQVPRTILIPNASRLHPTYFTRLRRRRPTTQLATNYGHSMI